MLSVILSSLVYLNIWSNLNNVLWVSFFFCVFILCSLCFYVHIIAEKSFFALLCVSNLVLIIFLSDCVICRVKQGGMCDFFQKYSRIGEM